MKKIALIGECMIEMNGKPFGEMRQSYGGDTLNTATYLSRIASPENIRVYYVSALGNDNLSREILRRWQEDKINTDWVLSDPGHQPGLYLIQLDKNGERTFLYWRDQSAARYMVRHPRFNAVLHALKTVDMIYLSGISLAILPKNDRTFLIHQLRQLSEQGVEIAFDSNFRPKLWESVKDAQDCYLQILSITDLALVTFDDEQLLWGDATEQDTLQRLQRAGIARVVVKCGSQGALFADKFTTEVTRVPTEPVKNIIDTTAAGDSFNAGFLQGYLNGKSLDICCRQGNQIAGIVIQHKGAIINKSATRHLKSQFN